MTKMDKLTINRFWDIFWNMEENEQFHFLHEFIELGADALEEMSGDDVSMDEVKDYFKMIIDNME